MQGRELCATVAMLGSSIAPTILAQTLLDDSGVGCAPSAALWRARTSLPQILALRRKSTHPHGQRPPDGLLFAPDTPGNDPGGVECCRGYRGAQPIPLLCARLTMPRGSATMN